MLQGALGAKRGSLIVVDIDRRDGGIDYLILELTRVACFRRLDGRGADWRIINAPREAAASLLSSAGAWKFPALAAIIETPCLRPDGSVLDTPGYDDATCILFDPGGYEFGKLPQKPTRADALAALKVIADLVKDFPFVDPGSDVLDPTKTTSFSVVIAAILTALVRPSLRTAPLFAFSAPVMGSGKSLLADVVALIATGRPASMMTFTDDPDEERKRLLALLLGAAPIVCIDNIGVPLASDALCSVLTQSVFKDRILGASRAVEVPTVATFLATGNNLQIKGDLATRALACHLDPRCERPDERTFAVDLYSEVPKLRAKLVTAALTIARAYVVAGRPPQDVAPFGRFDDWSAMVREPLIWLGLTDPCKSRDTIVRQDPVAVTLSVLLEAWERCFGTSPTTVATAIETAAYAGDDAAALSEAIGSFSDRGQVNSVRLGKFISRHAGRVSGGLCFDTAGKDRRGIALWRVRRV
jgi:putative DNA primase/helicase